MPTAEDSRRPSTVKAVDRSGSGHVRPPGPPPSPLNGIAVRRSLLATLRRMMTYGDLTYLPVGRKGFYFVSHPDLIKEVQVTQGRKFTKIFAMSGLGNGVLSSEGEFHRRQRRLIQPAFHHSRVEAYGRVMVEYADRMQRGWADGEVIDVYPALTQLSLNVVCRTLFGLELDDQDAASFFEATTFLQHLSGEGTGFSMGLRGDLVSTAREETRQEVADAVTATDRFLYGLIERRRGEEGQGDDVLSMLLMARDEEGGGELMTDEEVRDEMMSLVAAGHETTASGLTWAFNVLADNPDIADRVHDELSGVLGGRLPSVADLSHLPYTEMVWLETLRRYPPIPAGGRRAIEDVEVSGYVIPAGDPVVLCHYLIHNDPRWYPDPNRFDPERWTPERRAQLHKYAYFPFGGGARRCIGEPLAELEGRMVLATIAGAWRMEPLEDHAPEPEIRVTLRPAKGLHLRVHRR